MIRFAWAPVFALLLAGPGPTEAPSPAGLVPLPCKDGPLQPVAQRYCKDRKHYVTPAARDVLIRTATALQVRYPGAIVRYMEASWPSGVRPMPPHLSHGDGRQIDLVLFYTDRRGRPLREPPRLRGNAPGYGAYEPPGRDVDRTCRGTQSPHGAPDPPANRAWRLDDARTTDLVRRLSAAPQVRRIFLEPHLKARLGLSNHDKIRFAGCQAARHDDHIHVDFVS